MLAWPWVTARPPPSCSLTSPPQQDGWENKMEKLVDQDKDGEITYLQPSRAKKDLTWRKLI